MGKADEKGLIVVGFDGSDASVGALEWAIEHARRSKSKILALTAFEVPWTIDIHPTSTDTDYGLAAERLQSEGLEKFFTAHPDVTIETQLIQHKPALALTEAAENADLLVVGSQGSGALPGMHLGSVATYCVHHAPCPVLVHRVAS
jgi:nucleotide-binding universal stress UspA family protein